MVSFLTQEWLVILFANVIVPGSMKVKTFVNVFRLGDIICEQGYFLSYNLRIFVPKIGHKTGHILQIHVYIIAQCIK